MFYCLDILRINSAFHIAFERIKTKIKITGSFRFGCVADVGRRGVLHKGVLI